MDILLYCRPNFEADLLAEFETKCADKEIYGYTHLKKKGAHLRYKINYCRSKPINTPTVKTGATINHIIDSKKVELFKHAPSLESLIFARQKLLVLADVEFETDNRVQEIIECLSSQPTLKTAQLSDVRVEFFDNEEGKQIAKFCKKFTVPLRKALRQQGILSPSASNKGNYLHLIFNTSQACTLALSIPCDRSEHDLGVNRLKMPSKAPSRSTLKLDEAIQLFFNKEQNSRLFNAGLKAVDLGACPGGWTYQLVRRKIQVEAVDHGEIDESLMQTGLVQYFPEDGFKYEPQEGNVDWLVCDMLEQPTRVAQLMLSWLIKGQANAALFNLKLPMSKRYKVVSNIIAEMQQALKNTFGDFELLAKHLYHNRDEVTVCIITNSQMLHEYRQNKAQ